MKSSRNIPHRELITVLALTMTGLGVYSLADHPLSLLGIEMRQVSLREYLDSNSPHPIASVSPEKEVLPKEDSIPVVSVSQSVTENRQVPDTNRQLILLTGDSMAEGLMFALKKYATYNGHTLKTIIWYGSTTRSWAETDTLRKLIDRIHPSFVFLSLGSNELFIRNIAEREPYIQDIIQQSNGTKFVWIGPPNWKKDTGIHELLLQHMGEDRYFISKDLTLARSTDGRHPTREASAQWADTLSAWVMQASRYPIKLEKPVLLSSGVK